jgi:hypothetical protein
LKNLNAFGDGERNFMESNSTAPAGQEKVRASFALDGKTGRNDTAQTACKWNESESTSSRMEEKMNQKD